MSKKIEHDYGKAAIIDGEIHRGTLQTFLWLAVWTLDATNRRL